MKSMAYRLLVGLFTLSLPWSASAVPAEGSKIMISGPSPHAVEIGKAIAEEGGNVVDVAVAVGLTLAVTSPYFGSLGGGGFALIKMDKEVHALDFREIAPKATSPTFYVQREKDSSITGGAAVGVPGFAAGLWEMHKKYGKLPWSRLFKEPLKLAQNGFRVSGEWHRKTMGSETRFNTGGKKYFFKKDGKPYMPGEILKQQSLGKALRLFRSKNVKGFYSGDVARDIVDTVKKTGGVIEMEDLSSYKVRWMKPLEADFKGYHLYLMPPPSSGGVVIKSALNLIEQVKMDQYQAFS
ncbi:MAG: gamma-glutamyltransferase, partial [Bdellovibrionales bacterium]|nr:gamma-glutamyltransferase [Bdellovibrionales bacterium]